MTSGARQRGRGMSRLEDRCPISAFHPFADRRRLKFRGQRCANTGHSTNFRGWSTHSLGCYCQDGSSGRARMRDQKVVWVRPHKYRQVRRDIQSIGRRLASPRHCIPTTHRSCRRRAHARSCRTRPVRLGGLIGTFSERPPEAPKRAQLVL